MDGLTKRVLDFCDGYHMFAAGIPVIACVSGGTDSMFLLDMLISLSNAAGFPLFAAHFNHRLRGEESDGDEEFVVNYCATHGVPVHVGSGDVAGEAERLHLGIEETARRLRYDFFSRLSESLGGARIATAHNADDNLETVIMRIARGTGLHGLCGIPPVNGNIIRPVLCLTRAEIEEKSRELGIPHREDSTNLSDDYTRNLIRHRVLPVLREINPALNVTEMTRLVREDDEYLSALSRRYLEEHPAGDGLHIPSLLALPAPLSSRVIRDLYGEGLGAGHVGAVLELCKSPDPSARLSLPGVELEREYQLLKKSADGEKTFLPRVLPLDSSVIIEEFRVKVTAGRGKRPQIYNSLTNFFIRWDKIDSEVVLRPRRPGDTIRTRAGTRSLKKLLIDKKYPVSKRDSLIVVSCGGSVLAVENIGQSVDTYPREGEDALTITIEKIK